MAIKTSTFSGWQLSGKTAKAFLAQVNKAKANKNAQASLRQGRELLKEYDKKGYVVLKPNNTTSSEKNNSATY